MHTNLKKIKSAILSGMIAAVSVASSLSTVSAPSLSAGAADSDNYAKLLQYSLYFYDGNMCGDVSTDCALSWRGNCHMNDDVVGGYHDAGDHVWFGVPAAYTASVLGWSYYEFSDAYKATGQDAHLKVITDRFAKFIRGATKLSGSSVSSLLIEKGEGNEDHSYWGAPEQQGNRGRMLWSSSNCANVAAEYAAALAANYVNFGNSEDLTYAKALYNFAKSSPGAYSCEFYGSGESGTADEISWAACWLYLATKDNTYMADVNAAPEGWWVMNWENVALGASILKGEITGDWSGAHELDKMTGDGYLFYNKWGSARYNANAQMCSLVAAKHGKGNSSWAKGQMEYLTGDKAFQNGQKHCLVIGFKSDSSRNAHHRAASGITDGGNPANDGTPNKNLLIGALCGGPADASGTYTDIRSDYVGNEVALDYNAGFVGAAAGLYSFYKTGSIDTSIEGVTKIYNGSSSSTPTPQPATDAPQQPVTNAPYTPSQPTTTQPNNSSSSSSSSDGDIVLTPSDMTVKTEKGDDGGINNYAEFKPQGAKSATLYLKVNSNDTEVSGAFGTWNGEWVQEDFKGVKVNSDKTVSVDYTIPSDVGSTVKAMVFWPHGDDVTIEKVVLHKNGSSSSSNTPTRTNAPNTPSQPTTTKANNSSSSSSSSSGNDKVLTPSDMTVKTEKGDDGGINNYAEFKPQGAKSATLYLKVNSNDTEVSGAFGTWNGEWVQEDFKGVKVNSDKTVSVDYKIPSDVGSTVKAMVFWPHGDDVTIEKVVLHMDGSSSSNDTPKVTQAPVTTTRPVTTTKPVTQAPVTQPPATQPPVTQPPQNTVTVSVYGDANLDGNVTLADALAILQYIANSSKYPLSDQAKANADCCGNGDGITANDALVIQQIDAGRISRNALPVGQPQ